MNRRRKTLPYPTELSFIDILKLKYDNQIKILNENIERLEFRLIKLEQRFELSSNITPRIQDPLPAFSPPSNTPTEIKDFHLEMVRQNAESFDNLELE